MERKAPPPRGFGGPPVANGAQPQPFARRNGPPGAFGAPPVAETTELTAPPPPPQQPHPPQSFGFPAARGPVNTSVSANRRGWKPGRVGGRHDSPLYGNHRKRPPSSSMDSNVSWSGSEIESIGGFGGAHSEQEQVSRLSWASSVAAKDEAPKAPQQDLASAASLFVAPEVQHQRTPPPAAASGEQETKQAARSESTMNIQPPKTPMGKPTQDTDGEISAVQRVRMELSSHASTRAGSRTNSSENVFASTIPPVYDEEKSGPQSCPSTFNNTKQPQFSIDKLRQLRSNELVASKLLPTRQSVNSLMGYVRELQLSEATLRKQLVKTKQHTEEELSQSLSKVSELERTMMEVERDREMARRKLEEQEKLIRDLAAKLKQVEAVKAKVNASSSVDELPPIAEESQAVTEKTVPAEEKEPGTPDMPPLAPSPSAQPPPTQRDQAPLTPVQPKDSSRAAQFGLASPRSPNQPLWDPWASGGATPMKNLPPVFTIGSTSLDPAVASSTSAAPTSAADATTTAPEYELKSVLMSPRRDQGQDEASETGDAVEPVKQNESAVAAQQEFAAQYPGAVFNVEAMPSPPYPQHENLSSAETQDGEYGAQSQEKVPLMKSPVQVVPMAMAPTVTVAPVDDNSFDQQEASYVSAEGTNGAEWNVVHDLHVMQPPVASFPPPAEADPVGDAAKTIDENVTPAVPPSFADQATISPPPQAMSENSALDLATPYNESTQTAQSEQTPTADGENVATTMSSSPPLGSASFQPPPMSGDQPPRPASPAKTESKKVAAEPVSLETLLVDFFTEVDKKRLKMAKVYGKRYAGREKWLFAELTKRYGADKVAALKARYEYGIATTTTNTSSDRNGKQDDHVTKSPDTISKAGRQGHPRHPQFFHPPTPANKADLGAAVSPVSPPAAPSQENNSPNSQPIQKEKEAEAPSSPSQKTMRLQLSLVRR
ncbi:hypothetical protein L915_02059 [Phytophthora nicotianae]|uniref:Uncharacterized protein n=1 Tax=Phytophthora nicotianae TaxID=4792 RepID=W2HI83_PHYNI|nr:hypothetical protein L915_02059 [Phytophthora nicotianae]ETL48362.1 hypothetical protein L916_02031 [Phytophthora nicotianae]